MNSVDRVKALCKERGVSIAKLERELGFGNGYIAQLKKGVFPVDRLYKIANYFNVDPDDLVLGATNEKTATVSSDGNTGRDELKRLIDRLTDQEVSDLLAEVKRIILG